MEEEEVKKLMTDISKKNGEAIAEAVKTAIGESAKGLMKADEFATKLEASGLSAKAIKDLSDTVEKQGDALRKLQLEGVESKSGNWKENISKAFNDEKIQEGIMKTFKNGAGMVNILGGKEEFAAKVVGNITTANVTTTSGGNALLDLMNAEDIQGMNLRDPFIESYASVSRTAKPVYTYADFIPGEGDSAFLAESATKSQVDLDVIVRTVAPKKVAAYEIMSEEALTDIPRMDSEAKTLLLKRVLLKRQNKILFGLGAGDDPLGVVGQARAFDASYWTGDKVTDVNLYDVIVALANQIYTTFNYTDESHYYPNLCILHPSVLAAMKLKKNEFGMYLFPQFQLVGANGQTINVDGITVLPQRDIPAAKIMIGDFSKLRIINYIDYSLRMGFVNDQFIKNLFTMLGESRFYTVIKELDRNAFIYDDISDVVAGIQAV